MSDPLAEDEHELLAALELDCPNAWQAEAAALAVHRWKLDLQRDVGQQRYGHPEHAIQAAAADLAAIRPVAEVAADALAAVRGYVQAIADHDGVDIHEPGPLVATEEVEVR